MPSLRQKVTTYFRQLSFIAEPRDGSRSPRKTTDDGNFITKYLEGRMERNFVPGPSIFNGQNPTDLPELKIGTYPTGPSTITAACTGPDDGLTGIKRSKLHLSASYADDIDFIDTIQDNDCFEVRKSITTGNRNHNKFNRFGGPPRKLSNGVVAPVNDQNANKALGIRSRKNSRTSIANASQQQSQSVASSNKGAATKTTSTASTAAATAATSQADNANSKSTTIVVSMVCTKTAISNGLTAAVDDAANDQNNKNLLNATKTESLPSGKAATATAATAATSTNSNISAHTKDDNAALSDCITTNTNTNVADATNIANVTTTTTTTATANGTRHSDNNILCDTSNTAKLLEDATERLLQEAVSNCGAVVSGHVDSSALLVDSVAGVTDWSMETDYAYGISVSLYENNMLTKEPMGNPIADCYGMVVRGDAAAMALADGVNWGDGARLAARSAVHGCLDYLDRAIFGLAHECMATSTQEVFVSLLRSLWEGHGCILEVGGALSTLTIALILPLASGQDEMYEGKYVVCACNVGDSLGYVYSKTHGVRELTQASHDIASMRDMRDALGALGPADGNKPELSNLTFSMTVIERGDIVFLTSDGVSDNFDPVVGKFAEAWTPDVKLMSSSVTHGHHQPHLASKRQNKSASSIYARLHQHHHQQQSQHHNRQQQSDITSSTSSPASPPLSAPASGPVRPPRTKKSTSLESGPAPAITVPSRPKYMRSHTVIEPRRPSSAGNPAMRPQQSFSPSLLPKIPKSVAGLPLVTGPQRHALTLYRLEDLLSYGINGTFSPCTSARRLCHLLIDFVRMITSARRKTLEQRELFYKLGTGPDGIKREVELNRLQHRAARKRVVDSSAFTALPGKLDHATVAAYTVGGGSSVGGSGGVRISPQGATTSAAATSGAPTASLQSAEFDETNF